MLIGGIALAVLLIVGLILLRKAGGGNFPWIQFYTKGKESGFNVKEINLLRRVAVENQLENPTSLFWSIRQLDRSIKGMIIKFRAEGKIDEPASAEFLAKLFDFRRRVELNLPRYTLGLKTTRKLAVRQRMKITLPGIGTYFTSVVENLRRYLAISYPEGPNLPEGFTWKGQKLSIYFWRADDAGYVFETRVLEDFTDKQYPILHIAHSDNLVRSQKRRSVRVPVSKPAYLYPQRSIEQANLEEETSPGLRCRLVDISDSGAAILIGGKAKVGLALKLQFSLVDETVVMNGVVKGLTFNQKKNQSILHIQSVPLPARIRNEILSFVYNIFNEREPVDGSSVMNR